MWLLVLWDFDYTLAMRIIADLHIHSKFARACSKQLTPDNLDLWARKKGIGILGTGDFTHPGWMGELEDKLEEARPGLYSLRSQSVIPGLTRDPELTRNIGSLDSRSKTRITKKQAINQSTYFMFTAEVSSIYKQGDKVRRVHNLVFAPSMEAAKKFSAALEKRGANLKSDGRPIMGIHCDELVKIAKDVHENMEIIPAHAWTPHFGVFGSLSGFDSLEEAFGDQTKYIFAIETGLSSDPKMNWQVENLDNISLISNSDPHSLHRLGREANIFDIDPGNLSYNIIIDTIRSRDPKHFLSTIEFFPEEGRYHLDGHRDCKFSCLPEETIKRKGVCPVCGKQLLRGVLNRVEALGQRRRGFIPPRAIPYTNLISLEEVIANVFAVGASSKKVQAMYEQVMHQVTEFELLLTLNETEISAIANQDIASTVVKMRQGAVHITPGYDGLYGVVELFTPEERQVLLKKPIQMGLF